MRAHAAFASEASFWCIKLTLFCLVNFTSVFCSSSFIRRASCLLFVPHLFARAASSRRTRWTCCAFFQFYSKLLLLFGWKRGRTARLFSTLVQSRFSLLLSASFVPPLTFCCVAV